MCFAAENSFSIFKEDIFQFYFAVAITLILENKSNVLTDLVCALHMYESTLRCYEWCDVLG